MAGLPASEGRTSLNVSSFFLILHLLFTYYPNYKYYFMYIQSFKTIKIKGKQSFDIWNILIVILI